MARKCLFPEVTGEGDCQMETFFREQNQGFIDRNVQMCCAYAAGKVPLSMAIVRSQVYVRTEDPRVKGVNEFINSRSPLPVQDTDDDYLTQAELEQLKQVDFTVHLGVLGGIWPLLRKLS